MTTNVPVNFWCKKWHKYDCLARNCYPFHNKELNRVRFITSQNWHPNQWHHCAELFCDSQLWCKNIHEDLKLSKTGISTIEFNSYPHEMRNNVDWRSAEQINTYTCASRPNHLWPRTHPVHCWQAFPSIPRPEGTYSTTCVMNSSRNPGRRCHQTYRGQC